MAALVNESEFEEVCRLHTPGEVAVLKSVLEAAGILCYVANENLSRMVPFISNLPPFEMRVMVERARAQEARDLISNVATVGVT